MKKNIIVLSILAVGFANAQIEQEQRVGINTLTPRASLEVSKIALDDLNIRDKAQGLLIPHLSQEERNTMARAKLVQGLQIYNVDKTCVNWWNGSTWQCMDGSLYCKRSFS